MILVSNRFGGLDSRRGANLIGPNLAQDLSNVVLDTQGIGPLSGPGASVATLAGTVLSAYKFNGTWILSTEARQYVETDGKLIYCVSGQHPKKTTDGTTWHNLGLQAPQIACSAADAGSGAALAGIYDYYVTFIGQVPTTGTIPESGPSPVATVTAAGPDDVNLTAIPTHISTGDIATGTDTILNVANASDWQIGMRIIGQIAAGTSAPDASVGIPANATVTAVGATSLTISANATATAAGIRLTDPQFTGRRIYRGGGTQSDILLITTISDMTTVAYTDNTAEVSLSVSNTALATTDYTVPLEFDALAVSPTGVLMGTKGRVAYPSKIGLPHAFLTDTVSLTCNETIKGIAHYAGAFAVFTTATVYIIDGTQATNFQLVNTPSQQGCTDRDTVINMGDVIMYRSPDGICAFNGRDSEVISKLFLSDAFMTAISTSNNKAVRYNERYYLFHSAGFLVYDPRQDGSPWNKGDLGTSEATAAHYDRLADILYVVVPNAGTGEVRAWEAGSALTWSYTTGEWHGSAEGLEDFFRSGRLVNNGAVTLTPTVDGTAGSAKTLTRSTLGPSDFWINRRGLEVSFAMTGTGSVRALYADIGTEASRL